MACPGFPGRAFLASGDAVLGLMVELFRNIIAALRSLLAYVSVSLWVILLGPPGMCLAVLFDWPHVLYLLGRGGVRLGLGTVGITYRVVGQEHIQQDRATVYCVNHSSNIEPPILYMSLAAIHPRLRILYKSEIHKIPVLSRAFDIVGFVPIARQNREQSMRAIDEAAEALRDGNSFLIFPEGTRSRTGELQRFKKGGFIMAIKGRAAIVPVAIQGTQAAMQKGSPIIRPVTVSIRFGSPVEFGNAEMADRDKLIELTSKSVKLLLDRGPVTDLEILAANEKR